MKAWPIDPFDFKSFKQEVSEKLPQAILVLDWSISKKTSSLKLRGQNELKFGEKHLWKVLY